MLNIKSANIILYIVAIGVLFELPLSGFAQQQTPIWPIRPNVADWNQVNCTFGEIHGEPGDHFHTAIDIDENQNQVPAPSASVVQPGEVIDTFASHPGTGVVVRHEYPPNSGRFERRTQYLHLTGNIPALHSWFGTGGNIGLMGNHLHFVMEEWINGEWVRLNPLDKENNWNLRYHQYLEGRPDTYDPQINDIYVEPKAGITAAGFTPNGVASGYWYDKKTAVGLSERVADNVTFCRVHLTDTTPISNFSIAPLLQYPNDKLILFGNIGLTTNVRDVGINSVPGANTSSGEGLAIKQLHYSIENQNEGIQIPIKYGVNFERMKDADRDRIGQIFNLHFDANNLIYGNNDFIELRSGDDTYLSPSPNVPVGQVQSNGIWATKARADTEHVFRYTPDDQHVARCNVPNEAKYPDGEYTVKFFVQDDWGRINRAVNMADVKAIIKVIVDNFRPFLRQIELRSGAETISTSAWAWDAAQGRLTLTTQTPDPAQPLTMLLTFSNTNNPRLIS